MGTCPSAVTPAHVHGLPSTVPPPSRPTTGLCRAPCLKPRSLGLLCICAPMPPKSCGCRASSLCSCCLRSSSQKMCSTYDCESGARFTRVCAPGYVHVHQPTSSCHPSFQNSCSARPSGAVVLGSSVVSHTACTMVWGVPLVRACHPGQQSRRCGITIAGAIRCPGTRSAKKISLDVHGLLGPYSACPSSWRYPRAHSI